MQAWVQGLSGGQRCTYTATVTRYVKTSGVHLLILCTKRMTLFQEVALPPASFLGMAYFDPKLQTGIPHKAIQT